MLGKNTSGYAALIGLLAIIQKPEFDADHSHI